MGLFKLKKNKRFNYKPRFYKGVGNPFELKHKFEDQRTTVEKNNLKKIIRNLFNGHPYIIKDAISKKFIEKLKVNLVDISLNTKSSFFKMDKK